MRSLVAIAALAALASTCSNAAETVLKNKAGTVVGVFSCDEATDSCSIKGEYLELEVTGFGVLVTYKASFPEELTDDSVFAYTKVWGDCVHVLTDFGKSTFYINWKTKIGASKPQVCGDDGFFM
jgi:hypothetical protein